MSIPSAEVFKDQARINSMSKETTQATTFLKAMAHESRMMILCYLSTGEKTVTELEELLTLRQPAVSQQLARLRNEGIISARRDGKTIWYSIQDDRAQVIMGVVYELFCGAKKPKGGDQDR